MAKLLKRKYCKYSRDRPDAIRCEYKKYLKYEPCYSGCEKEVVREIGYRINKMFKKKGDK